MLAFIEQQFISTAPGIFTFLREYKQAYSSKSSFQYMQNASLILCGISGYKRFSLIIIQLYIEIAWELLYIYGASKYKPLSIRNSFQESEEQGEYNKQAFFSLYYRQMYEKVVNTVCKQSPSQNIQKQLETRKQWSRTWSTLQPIYINTDENTSRKGNKHVCLIYKR